MKPSSLHSLYKDAKINLWVEDSLTVVYLLEVWDDSDLGFHVAGRKDAIGGVVGAARSAGFFNVFGLQDRDFGQSNEANWLLQDKNTSVFIGSVFEIENHLLDPGALAQAGPDINRNHRDAAHLGSELTASAADSLWWMSVRATLAELSGKITQEFPTHPKLANPSALKTQNDAEAELETRCLNSPWGRSIKQWVPRFDANELRKMLIVHHDRLDGELASGAWLQSWSGKEILLRLKNYLGYGNIEDLARALGRHQRSAGTVPLELIKLREALRKRAGVDPW